jgi:rod shape-determining protein MreD
MRKFVGLWGVVTLLVLLHFLLHVGFGIDRGAPDLLTVALLLAAREVTAGTAAGMGFFFGLLEDAFSVLAFGANTLAMTVIGALGAVTRDFFVGESWMFHFLYLVLGKWLRDALFWVLAGPEVRGPAVRTLLVQAPLAAVYAAAVGLVLLILSQVWRGAEA